MPRHTAPALQPRKAPRQRRALATRDLLLEAAARVLAQESLAGFNTIRVAAVAGVSIGSLYQYFPNKQALVAALVGQVHDALAVSVEAAAAAAEALPAGDLVGALRLLADLAVAQQYDSPRLAAALDHEERHLPLDGVLEAAEARIVAAVQALLERHAAALDPHLGPDAARDCLTLAKALVDREAQRSPVPPPDLAEHVLRALYGYLTVRLPAQTPASGR